ncbi:MAG: choice-of-anchor tandem repeat GloVer-containing protein, partial [Flammeovirgaceae bacterium]
MSIENTGDFSLGSATGNSKTYVDRLGHAPVGMVQAYNGKFYGVTNGGGQFNQGVVFELDPATNSYRKIVDFNKDKDFKVNSNSNPKDFKNLAASSDGKKIYTTYADSLLVAVTIAPAPQVQKPFTFMPPIPPIEGTFNINSLTTVKTSTTEKLCWITQFYPDGDYIYKER